MPDDMIDDRFETVAVTWSQSEAAVMMSMFAWHDIPALTVGEQSVRTMSYYAVALQGIHVRVHHEWLAEARALLADVAERPAAVRPYALGRPWLYRAFVLIAGAMFAFGIGMTMGMDYTDVTEERVVLIALLTAPFGLLMAAAPPTRTASTFLLRDTARAG